MTPTLCFYSGAELLEGPVFDTENNLLYFVSIFDCLVYCYNPTTKEMLSVKLDTPVSCIFLSEKKKVFVSAKSGFFKIDFNTLEKEFAFQINIDKTVRYNDGIKDPVGRFIIGTMGYPEVIDNIGKVYSYHEGEYKTIIKNTTISNGLAFSLDNKYLYFIDTPTKKVAKYQYKIKNGEIEFDSYVIEFGGESSPDGMCIDKDGMLWIAEWGGACVSKWNPLTGNKIDELKLPCTNVTSCCFDNKNNLYVTTAISEEDNSPISGGLYYIELNSI